MQKNFGTIFLQLFLCLLPSIILLAYSYSDFRSSLQADCSTVLNSVMPPPKSRTTRKKSLLEGDHSSVNLSKSSTSRKRRLLDGDHSSANLYHAESQAESASRLADICVNSCKDAGSTIVGGSSFLGQALYQKSKQGMTLKYEDFGDNVFACNHCGACVWLKEASKQRSKNAPINYTNCCKKGEIKVQQSNPTPAFLEHLLNLENGPESRLFRDNIRVYIPPRYINPLSASASIFPFLLALCTASFCLLSSFFNNLKNKDHKLLLMTEDHNLFPPLSVLYQYLMLQSAAIVKERLFAAIMPHLILIWRYPYLRSHVRKQSAFSSIAYR